MEKSLVKVWMFYLDRNYSNYASCANSNKEYTLYGITNIKKFAKEFRKSRNMEIFQECVKYFTLDEYSDLANRSFRGCVLERDKLRTSKIYGNKIEICNVSMILTFTEFSVVSDNCTGMNLNNYVMLDRNHEYLNLTNPAYFNKILFNSLTVLQYNDFWKLQYYTENYNEINVDWDTGLFKNPPIADELSCFIELYGHLMK